LRILLISSQDYIHHPVPSRHHYIFERLSKNNEVHVAHFHISDNPARYTNLIVEDTTLFPINSLIPHYTLNSPYHLYKFNQIIQKDNIDVIVAAHVLAGTAAIIAGKYNNVPVLFDLKDWFPDSAAAYFKNPLLKSIVHDSVLAITKYNLSNSTKITTVSPNLVTKLKSLGYNSHLITNGVDTSIFKPFNSNILRQQLGLKDADFVIGFAGSIERWYDIDSLLQITLKNLEQYNKFYNNDIKLLLVGGSLFTDYQQEIKNKVLSLGLQDKVIFTGLIPYNDLSKYINCMDVCTIPLSPKQWVNIALPNKFFEYTACGKPILTTPIPNVMDFNYPNIYVYNNFQEMKDKLISIIEQKPKFDINFKHQDWDNKALEMEIILNSLVK